jgi:hypothetical protein
VFKASTHSPGYQTTPLCVSSPSEATIVLLTLGFYLAHEQRVFILGDICLFFVHASEN